MDRKIRTEMDNYKIANVLNSTPLYMKYEKQYREKVELPMIESQKEKLWEIRDKSIQNIIS